MRPQPASRSASAKSCACPAPARGRSRRPKGERHTGRAVVIATGLAKGRLGLPEEDEYEGRGLSHCASCDGPLYAGQPVIVAGSGGWAPHEAEELKAFASEVTVIDTVAAKLPDGVRRLDGRIVALEGSNGLQSVVVESGGARKTIPTSAVFVYVGQSPAAEFVPDSLARDATGHIVVDRRGPHLRRHGVCRRRRAGRRTLLSGRRHRRRPACRAGRRGGPGQERVEEE